MQGRWGVKVYLSVKADLMIKVSHRKKATRLPLKTREISRFFWFEGCFFPVFGRFRLYGC